MARYRLGNTQIKRLISGNFVNSIDGSKYYAGDDVKGILKDIDDNNLYSVIDVLLDSDTRSIVFERKDKQVESIKPIENAKTDYSEETNSRGTEEVTSQVAKKSIFKSILGYFFRK